jgi:AcrR family transcriptional regulator
MWRLVPVGEAGIVRNQKRRVRRTGGSTADEIYDATVRLMCDRGYHGTSLRSVAARVGIEMASLYYHFKSKQDLLAQIMQRIVLDLIATVEGAVADIPDPEARLRTAIREHILFHGQRRREAFLADAELRSLEPPNRAMIVGLRERYQQIFETIFLECVDREVLLVRDIKLATLALMTMCTGVAGWYRPGGRLSLDTIADQYTELALSGLISLDNQSAAVGNRA